jgi:hypothetical protein
MNTKSSLGIYWSIADPSSGKVYQDEVSGLIFYGYWRRGYASSIADNLSEFKAVWDGGVDIKPREWDGEDVSNMSIEVKINVWPDKVGWISCIEKSLRWFVDGGALVSWCGTEMSSPELDVFIPEGSSGSIYAAYSKKVGLLVGSGLEEEFRELDEKQIKEFQLDVYGARFR